MSEGKRGKKRSHGNKGEKSLAMDKERTQQRSQKRRERQDGTSKKFCLRQTFRKYFWGNQSVYKQKALERKKGEGGKRNPQKKKSQCPHTKALAWGGERNR